MITQAGATPVFVDIESDYMTIDVTKIEEKITNKTKAIIPVHLYGQPAEIQKIKKICKDHDLYLIEDCAQSHFSKYKNKNVGTYGDIGTFSFYPGKNLGAYGDGGGIITNDKHLADRIRMIAQHGSLVKHQHLVEGVNSRLDGIQAAILSVKLPYLSEWNKRRNQAALRYNSMLKDCENIIIPAIRENSTHIFHVYCVRFKSNKVRDDIKVFLENSNIQVGVHYPTPLPLLPAYQRFNHTNKDFPVARKATETMLSLPMFPEITVEQQEYVCNKIIEFFNSES